MFTKHCPVSTIDKRHINLNLYTNIDRCIEKLADLSQKLAEQRHISAIRRGLLINMPLMVIGSFAIMFSNLPLPWYRQEMTKLLGFHWENFGTLVSNASSGIMSFLLVLSISYFLTENHSLGRKGIVNPFMTALVSLACLITLVQPLRGEQSFGLPFAWIGVTGISLAMLSALISTEIFLGLGSIKKLQIGKFCDESDPILAQALTAMIPAALTLVFFAAFKMVALTNGISDIYQFIYGSIRGLFIGLPNSLSTAMLHYLLRNLFWLLGMHGPNVIDPVFDNIYLNTEQITRGSATQIITKTFLDIFANIGGSGSTLSLILALLLVSFRGNTAWLAKLSVLPGIFNINEILLFGLPIILNPIYLIPFILVPMLSIFIAWTVTIIGLVPVVTHTISWTTPPLLSGYVATGSWRGTLLQIIIVFSGTLIYLPFVQIAKKQKYLETKYGLGKLLKCVDSIDPYSYKHILNRRDSVGHLGRIIGYDLKEALEGDGLILEYQPQVAYDGRVIGVEALLRWPHKEFGYIPPPVIVTIAEENGLIHDLGNWVLSKACKQLREWKESGIDDLRMSVNVSVLQLYHGTIAENVLQAIKSNNLPPGNLEIEITEKIALNNDSKILANLNKLNEIGVRIAIDDFGTGHGSLTYIKNFPVDTLKIDVSLSRDVVSNRTCQEILTTIVNLCSSIDIEIVVEYVETEEQRNKLYQLGCSQYQGYFYSPALPEGKAKDYIQKSNIA